MKNNRNYKLKTRIKPQSVRQLKIAQEIHLSLVECLQKSGKLDHRLENCHLTITKINVSPDLQIANCFYLPLNSDISHEIIEDALKSSTYAIRQYVTKKLNLKYSPKLQFFFDVDYESFSMLEEPKGNIK
ncbi:MAG TPA: ribosome-binding factor A [Candidatus Megaira endosymbiont of Nemacystus decipiens]|nr:ribosome-binding factor A [Candidatus Megaera endosymbiont of Nemacystus decipiens]